MSLKNVYLRKKMQWEDESFTSVFLHLLPVSYCAHFLKNGRFIHIFVVFFFSNSKCTTVLLHKQHTCILISVSLRSNCAENIRKHILHTGKHEGVKMYNCPKCTFGTNSPTEFRNHLKEHHADIENPDLAYLHAGRKM